MTTPKSSPTLKPIRNPDAVRDQRRIVSDTNALHPLAPSFNQPRSPELLNLPDTSDDNIASDSRVPLLAPSAVGSTPSSFKYIRAPQSDPFETPTHTESSGDRSFSTPSTVPNSNSSASMEIFLGPQPMSFVHHRQRLTTEDFERSPTRPSPAEYATKGHNGIVVKVDSNDDAKNDKDNADKSQLSTWRQKQLKKFKPSRPVAGARERPIPLLHGPLSLPYARNPSGVDATVADQSSYMTHVFGLRAAISPETKGNNAGSMPRARIPSDSTHRTVSSSSYLSTEGQSSDYPSTVSSFGSIKRPLMVRDYSQIIGIKKDMVSEGNQVYVNTDLLLPPSESHPHRSHSDLRAHLGLGKPLSPIPASPPPASAYTMGIDNAIHSTSGLPWPRQDDQELLGQSDFVSLALVDPVTNSVYNVRVPKSPSASALGTIPCEIVPTSARFNTGHQGAASKADASVNWRNRGAHTPSVLVTGSPGQVAPPPPSLAGSPYAGPSSPLEVLTLEQLSQKFGHMRVDSKSKVEKPSASPLVKKSEKTVSRMEPPPNMLSDSTTRQVNVQANTQPDPNAKPAAKKKLRIAVNKSRSSAPTAVRTKGTPGAGKHLKHATTEENDTPVKAI